MKGWIYQLKSVRKDKFCIMSFFLPVLVAILLNFADSIDLSSLGELQFVLTAGDLTSETTEWLARYGTVMICQTEEELISEINDPSTNLIGVEKDGNGIKTILSGDEWAILQQAAGTLPLLYEQRESSAQVGVQILSRPDILAGYQHIFAAMTLVVAMFMGCTFNAMNIISEKEEGVVFINEILPMSPKEYLIQKIGIGFVFGCLSALITAAICFRLPFARAAVMLALLVLSAFVSSLIGLFIGRFSNGLMIGVVYIKLVMIVFMAVPMISYLAGVENRILTFLSYLIPSSATLEGIMDLANGGTAMAGKDTVILAVHGIVWFLLYLLLAGRGKKQA